MVELLWEKWPLAEKCYKAVGHARTWIVRATEEGDWHLAHSPHEPTIVPDLIPVATYPTRDDAERLAQKIEDLMAGQGCA